MSNFPIILPKPVLSNLIAMSCISEDDLKGFSLSEFESKNGNGTFVSINPKLNFKVESPQNRVTLRGSTVTQLIQAGIIDMVTAKDKGLVADEFMSNGDTPTRMVSITSRKSDNWDTLFDKLLEDATEPELTEDNEMSFGTGSI
jgi:hypothetical protein